MLYTMLSRSEINSIEFNHTSLTNRMINHISSLWRPQLCTLDLIAEDVKVTYEQMTSMVKQLKLLQRLQLPVLCVVPRGTSNADRSTMVTEYIASIVEYHPDL